MQLNGYCAEDIKKKKKTLEKSLVVQTVAFPILAEVEIHPKVNYCHW